MESVKKWLNERSAKKNGMYVHYSPPKLVGVVTSAQLRQWARGGPEGRLERAVLAGQGRRLLAEAESLPLSNHSTLPGLVAKCDALHTTVERGSLLELQELLESDYNRRKYVMCRDEAGVGLLHKAVFYDYMDIAEYLVKNYPQLVHQKDSEGRTPLHYTAVCRDEAAAAALLEGAGAARGARDAAGRTPAHYRGLGRTHLALPDTAAMARENKNTPGLVIKRHNIRIWCHDCDMARLQRVVWEGHGSRLLSEVSSQPVVKRFLEAVPYIMNTIRDMHTSVVQNDLEGLMKHSGDPVPPQALSSRDPNNLTVMHKAAGLGHGGILKYIADRYPQGINDVDNDGRTPLHYAAAVRDDHHTYNTLVSLGANESAVDNKNKTPGYYTNRPQEIDKNIFKTLPEAPRTPSSAYPSHWDWKLLDTEVIVELNKKSKKRHLKASNENISSKDTNTTSESTDNQRTRAMKGSSTHELINNLPELDDTSKPTKDEVEINEDTEKADEIENEDKEEDEGDKCLEDVDNHDLEEKTTEVTDNAQDSEEEKAHDEEDTQDAEEENTHDRQGIQDAEEEITHDEAGTQDTEEEITHDKQDTQSAKKENAHGKENAHHEQNTHNENNAQDTEDINETNGDKEKTEEDESANETANTKKTTEHHEETADNTEIETEDNPIKEDDFSKIKESDVSEHEGDLAKDHEAENGHTNKTDNNTDNQDGDEEAPHAQPEHNDDANEHNDDTEHSLVNQQEDVTNNDKGENWQEHDKNNSHQEVYEKSNKENNDDKINLPGNDQVAADSGATTNEGKNNDGHSEDDDDVQVQGETHSEYSDSNLKSTADISDMGSAKRGNLSNGRSTQKSLIEGVISGEAEQDSQDASTTQGEGSVHGEVLVLDNEIDPEVTDLINNANMEMLAALVLNGEGSRLIGRRSRNSELQAFLDNVPTYMQKISNVHVAARDGNLRDLQAALDRRKFAIARDPISPNGATPLHVATIFGKTNIIKYLGGRFPETLSAVDFEGRTALHYAAVLPDNGHYYNLFQQLGANSKDLDDNGKSADEYHKNPSLLPFDHLLSDYGISEDVAKTMFSDKGLSQVDDGYVDTPMFNTDEGRYLAKCKLQLKLYNQINVQMDMKEDKDVYLDDIFTALGDPLIKGLTEVANVKPKDPVAFLASFLHNFPEKEKPNIGTQESNEVLSQEVAEPDSEQPSPPPIEPPAPSKEAHSGSRTATRPHRPIDVVTVDPQPVASPDAPETAFSSASRDEHGQSMLHFAAARAHARNALFQLLQESDISLGFRDELYRTARDVSIQANVPDNTTEIDRWVLHLAARGNTEKIMELLMGGYDHILDVVDEDGVVIAEVIAKRGDGGMSNLLASIPAFEESREAFHVAVRRGDLAAVEAALLGEGGRALARSQNSFGRTALHIAVLAQHEDIVTFLSKNYPELLRVGDNLERTPLHYAMGVDKLESLSRILIRAGAKRVLKDLKGRQPTYYFMNKSDILRLKEEEEVF